MRILTSINDVIAWRKEQNGSVGFVPTMGALHKGHLSLISRAYKENTSVIVSIFVNPTQFGANEDFETYPRNETADIELCRSSGVKAIFIPKAKDIYPNICETLILAHKQMSSVFEGAIRPGHFDGVLRVLLKFFHLISPHNVYFGKKDAQQLLIVRQMIDDLFLDINIVGCPIVRDSNHLALSSRNVYLDSTSYAKALAIPKAINCVANLAKLGEKSAFIIQSSALDMLNNIEVDYCEIVDLSLEKIDEIQENKSLLLLAARVGGVRLLDNFWF